MATILVVDDRATNRQVLSTLLGYKGHRIVEAADGAEGLAKARTERPDLVISDVLMPVMDGYELLWRLRAEPGLSEVPVIFYTATYRAREARALADACGASYVLGKPAEPEEVFRVVEEILGTVPAVVPVQAEPGYDAERFRMMNDKLLELESEKLRFSALLDLAVQLGCLGRPEAVLSSLCHGAREILTSRSAAAGILDESGSAFRAFERDGLPPAAAGAPAPSPRGGVLGRVLAERRLARLSDGLSDAQAAALFPETPRQPSLLAVPLASPSKLLGVLYLADKVGLPDFTQDDERVATAVAALGAVAYENAWRLAKLEELLGTRGTG